MDGSRIRSRRPGRAPLAEAPRRGVARVHPRRAGRDRAGQRDLPDRVLRGRAADRARRSARPADRVRRRSAARQAARAGGRGRGRSGRRRRGAADRQLLEARPPPSGRRRAAGRDGRHPPHRCERADEAALLEVAAPMRRKGSIRTATSRTSEVRRRQARAPDRADVPRRHDAAVRPGAARGPRDAEGAAPVPAPERDPLVRTEPGSDDDRGRPRARSGGSDGPDCGDGRPESARPEVPARSRTTTPSPTPSASRRGPRRRGSTARDRAPTHRDHRHRGRGREPARTGLGARASWPASRCRSSSGWHAPTTIRLQVIGPNGEALYLTREQRAFSAAQKLALTVVVGWQMRVPGLPGPAPVPRGPPRASGSLATRAER